MQSFIHYFLHLGLPLLVALVFFRQKWRLAYGIFLATMLVDLDHLLAEPIFKSNRCSIHYHPLHTYWAMIVYAAMLFFRWPYRIIGLGLLLHMATDFLDCMLTYTHCKPCLSDAPAENVVRAIVEWLGI